MGLTLIYGIATLVSLGIFSALILYYVAQKFKVHEDPRIDKVAGMLPGVNCGGCGFPGCHGLAEALVNNDDISTFYCPVGGEQNMNEIALFLGKTPPEKKPTVAEIRCGGGCGKRARTNVYDGAGSCAVVSALYGGETGCVYGCLGKGDCVEACEFDAMHMNPDTELPEVDETKCVSCGACVKACPKSLIELRKQGPLNRRVYVACRNRDKAAAARKACQVACIACGRCEKVCEYGAITIDDNLAFIDSNKCKLCRKCVPVCPTGAIIEVNFPPRPKTDTEHGSHKVAVFAE